MASTQVEEHFSSFHLNGDKSRLSSRLGSRSGRTSPAHSARGILIRHSIMKVSEEKRARKVRFYRNGDRFYKGMIFAVSTERFRTFESLLVELTNSPICDKNILPNGVRYIFSVNGGKKISNLEQLEEGDHYVVASNDVFRQIDYIKSVNPNWNINAKRHEIKELSSRMSSAAAKDVTLAEISKDYIKPKLITIIRNGSKPRRAIRVLLNKKTAHSFDQVLDDITEMIKLDSGSVKKLFTVDGRQVACLSDFFQEESIFIAYGVEKHYTDDFGLDDNEVKLVSAYKNSPLSLPGTPRITLRSPRSPRKVYTSSTNRSTNENGISHRNGSASPSLSRKSPATPRKKLSNGSASGDRNGPPALTSKYHIGKIIGDGNFATVRECTNRKTDRMYALKTIEKWKCKGKEQMISNEVSILRQLDHPNVVSLLNEYESPDGFYLVMELVKGGDLLDVISSTTAHTEKDASRMMFDLCSGLEHVHSVNIVHRDVKPENILVHEHKDGSQSLKLGDFGLAASAVDTLYTVCGTPTYVAPEVLAETGYSLKIDIWSAGVIAYILLCGFPPFSSKDDEEEELFEKIKKGKYEYTSPYWEEISDSAKDVISHMLVLDRTERFSASEVLKHTWVADSGANKDRDISQTLTKKVKTNFIKKPLKDFKTPAVRVIGCTALDKGSRYFTQQKDEENGLTLHSKSGKDETF